MAALAVLAVMLMWARLPSLASHPRLLLSGVAVSFAAMAVAARCGRRWEARPAGFSWVWIMVVAALLRLIAVAAPPSLSTDVYRYAWDGKVALSGANPYRLSPDAPELRPLRDDIWRQVEHRDVATVYPPLAMLVFAAAAATPAPILALKLIFALTDVLTVGLLFSILRRRALADHLAVWYAWNPLAVLETAAMGHVDALGVLLLVAAVAAIDRLRVNRAVMAAAGAALTKLVPVFALPVLGSRSVWNSEAKASQFRLRVLALLSLAAVVGLAACGGIPSGWVRFGVSWEFNGPLFEPLWRALESLRAPESVAGFLDQLKQWTGMHDFWNRFYSYRYPQFLAKVLLGIGLLAWLVVCWRKPTVERALLGVFLGLLLFSATVYPWYVLWLLPWAVVTQNRALIVLSGLSFVSYLAQIWGEPVFPKYWAVVWLGTLVFWLVDRGLKQQALRSGGAA